jgi:hypothetical protein
VEEIGMIKPNKSKFIRGTVNYYSYEQAASDLRSIGAMLEERGMETEARLLGYIGDRLGDMISAGYAQKISPNEVYDEFVKIIAQVMDQNNIYTGKPGDNR